MANKQGPPHRIRAQIPKGFSSNEQEHDVLIIPKGNVANKWEYFRVPVHKERGYPGRKKGEFHDQPEKWDLHDRGERKVVRLANLEGEKARGPALSTLPIKPEPAPASAHYGTCYLINAPRLSVPNLWTFEEWDDGPGGPNFQAPPHPNELEVLLAGPRGKVFRLRIENIDRWQDGQPSRCDKGNGASIEIESVQLRYESEIWSQLRNGCVAGSVLFKDISRPAKPEPVERVIPIVNVTSLEPAPTPNTVEPEGKGR